MTDYSPVYRRCGCTDPTTGAVTATTARGWQLIPVMVTGTSRPSYQVPAAVVIYRERVRSAALT